MAAWRQLEPRLQALPASVAWASKYQTRLPKALATALDGIEGAGDQVRAAHRTLAKLHHPNVGVALPSATYLLLICRALWVWWRRRERETLTRTFPTSTLSA